MSANRHPSQAPPTPTQSSIDPRRTLARDVQLFDHGDEANDRGVLQALVQELVQRDLVRIKVGRGRLLGFEHEKCLNTRDRPPVAPCAGRSPTLGPPQLSHRFVVVAAGSIDRRTRTKLDSVWCVLAMR